MKINISRDSTAATEPYVWFDDDRAEWVLRYSLGIRSRWEPIDVFDKNASDDELIKAATRTLKWCREISFLLTLGQ
jgi:hypothetical protein